MKNPGYNRSGHKSNLTPCYLLGLNPAGDKAILRPLNGKHNNTITMDIQHLRLPKSVLISTGFTL